MLDQRQKVLNFTFEGLGSRLLHQLIGDTQTFLYKAFSIKFLTLGRDRGTLTSKSIFNQGAPWYVLATDYHSLYADDVLNSPILKRVLVILFGGYKLAEVYCVPKIRAICEHIKIQEEQTLDIRCTTEKLLVLNCQKAVTFKGPKRNCLLSIPSFRPNPRL